MNFYPRPPRGGRPFHFVGQNLPGYFYPRPPRGGRPAFMPASPTARAFLSTPSARRATGASHGRSTIACYFYPRPPRGGRLRAFFVLIRHEFQFLSTPSARRATAAHRMDSTAQRRFLSTPSARRATHFKSISGYTQQQFLSTPSARRATVAVAGAAALAIDFYPRPPRGGRPGIVGLHCVAKNISIHALREEGDPQKAKFHIQAGNFYPRPPRGGRPCSPFCE